MDADDQAVSLRTISFLDAPGISPGPLHLQAHLPDAPGPSVAPLSLDTSGAAARPMLALPGSCLARLSMWQAWPAAHSEAQLPVLPAKEPDAAIGKNCFTI